MDKQQQQAQIIAQRLQAFFQAAIHHRETILVAVDHVHWLCGSHARCPVTIVIKLLSAFARRKLQLICTCTPAQFQNDAFHIAGLQRPFTSLSLS